MNIGVAGLGNHSTAYVDRLVEDACGRRLTALCDTDERRLRAYAEHYFKGGAPRLFTSPEALIESGDIDALIICTPDHAHMEIALAAMEKGLHILLEKPMEASEDRLLKLYRQARSYPKTFMLGFVLRYAPMYIRIKEIADSGEIGETVSARAEERLAPEHAASFMRRWHRFREKSGGILNSKCCHDMDILSYIIGSDAEYVSAFAARDIFKREKTAPERCRDCSSAGECLYVYNYAENSRAGKFTCEEDLCAYNAYKEIFDGESVMIKYKNGVTAQFELCLFSAKATRTLTLNGTKATLFADLADASITIAPLGGGKPEIISLSAKDGHGGGDDTLLPTFLKSAETGLCINDSRAGYLASLTAFSADRAIAENRVVRVNI